MSDLLSRDRFSRAFRNRVKTIMWSGYLGDLPHVLGLVFRDWYGSLDFAK